MSNEEMLEILRGKVLVGENIASIQQRLDEIADAIEQLVRERDAAVKNGKALMATAQHAIKERDAAVADCKLSTICESCKHHGDDEWCERGCRWEWRGVQE